MIALYCVVLFVSRAEFECCFLCWFCS